jgi:Leucine-rich repeat (LRR) protein
MLKLILPIILSYICLATSQKVLVCQVSGDTCTFTSKTVEKDERIIIVADHQHESNNDQIKKVEFLGSSMYSIPAELFRAFVNLEKLIMTNQNIKEMTPNTFQNAGSLKKLFLGSNEIQRIDEGTFDGAWNLSGIWIDNNLIETIDKNAFKKLIKLMHLGLWQNRISSLNTGIFSNNPELIGFDISRNRLKVLHKNLFINNQKLQQVTLHFNQLSQISSIMFSHLSSMNSLHLSSNRCINKDWPANAHEYLSEIEMKLIHCGIAYLSLENDELISKFETLYNTISIILEDVKKAK